MLDRLAIPIIQGPMLGASTRAMALAVSNAGALGSFAASGLNGAALKDEVAQLKAATDRPFAINLFVQKPAQPDSAAVSAAIERLRPLREELGLPPQAIPNAWAEDFDAQFEALVAAAPPVASFTFGILSVDQCARLKARGVFVVGTATTVAEGRAWQAVGADAVVAQGFEAGGHRGTFLKPVEDSLVGVLSLVSTMVPALDIPVIAAGGIANGRGVAAALTLGAAAAQIGTAFLTAPESAISQPWREAIANVGDDATRLTRAITGRHARGIENRIMRELRPAEADIPPYPVQNMLTQELRAAAAKQGKAEYLSLWSGQSVALYRPRPAAQIVADLWRETEEAFAATAQRFPSLRTGAASA